MEGLKNLAIVALVVVVLWKIFGCSCGGGCKKEQSHPRADDRRPTPPGRAQPRPGCNPFACDKR